MEDKMLVVIACGAIISIITGIMASRDVGRRMSQVSRRNASSTQAVEMASSSEFVLFSQKPVTYIFAD
jgi:hypothetical protein